MKPTGRLMWDTLTVLALRLPLRRPVFLHFVRGAPQHGTTELRRDGFHIEIRRGNRHVMLDTLLHEWAHARAWSSGIKHTARWGTEYARAYRVVWQED